MFGNKTPVGDGGLLNKPPNSSDIAYMLSAGDSSSTTLHSRIIQNPLPANIKMRGTSCTFDTALTVNRCRNAADGDLGAFIYIYH